VSRWHPRTLRGRITLANVALLAAGLVLAGIASLVGMYTLLVGEIDDSLHASQAGLERTSLTADSLRRLCTTAGLVESSSTNRDTITAFDQDLFVILDPHGRTIDACLGQAVPATAERARLTGAVSNPGALATSGDAATVSTGGDYYRVAVARLDDGSMVVKGMRLNGVIRAVFHLFIVEAVVGILLLGLLATGSLRAVRRRLRPLEQMVETASAIAGGELSRRVPEADKASAEVDQLSVALNTMLHQIEQALLTSEDAAARLRQFVADASHELRTPLATVRGYLELYQKCMLDAEESERALTRVAAESERMSRLVDELLSLARMEHRPALWLRAVDLRELVHDGVADLRAQQPQRPVSVTCPGDGPVEVRGDEAKLRQVVGNLLSNVRVHTPAESPVTVGLLSRSGDAVLSITDTGPGMREEDASRVFDRFFRADPDRARATGGSGLGMSIVEAVIHAHDGAVAVETAPGAGLTVRVTLPVAANNEVPGHEVPDPGKAHTLNTQSS
jgi:two-component system OmpR family sensor kinase